MHSLTLGRIIRLNTGFKTAPDNVFYSTQYCASVKDFQCAPHIENMTGSCENIQQKLKNLERKLAKRKQDCNVRTSVEDTNTSNNSFTTVIIVVCVVFSLAVIVLLVISLKLWFRLQQREPKTIYNAEKNAGLEMDYKKKEQSSAFDNSAEIS